MELYYLPASAPSRAVEMTALALGVPLKMKKLHEINGEHHSVPTLKDKDLVLWESRAIQMYLVDRYGAQKESLYPKDPVKRAKVNQRMFFDACILYQRFTDYYHEQVYDGLRGNDKKLTALEDAVQMLELFLVGTPYVTGETMTIVDLSMLATVATMNALGFDLKRYPNVFDWYKHMRDVAPGADLNEAGAKEFSSSIK